MKNQIGYIITSIIILVIAMFIFSYIFNPSVKYQTKSFLSDIKDKVLESSLKIQNNIKTIECPEGIIPKEIILRELGAALEFCRYWHSGSYNNKCIPPTPIWEDGQDISNSNPNFLYWNHACAKGNEEGQNINYFYCYDWEYSKTTKDILGEGEIKDIKTISYNIDLVLKEKELIYERKPNSQEKLKNYEVIESTCELKEQNE